MFKKTKRNKRSIVPLMLLAFLVLILTITGYIVYNKYFPKKAFYISPVVSQGEPLIDKVKNILMKESIPFTQIVASDSSYLIFLRDGGRVIFPQDYNIEGRIYSLQVILKQFTIEGKKFKQIDFRFDKPTILF